MSANRHNSRVNSIYTRMTIGYVNGVPPETAVLACLARSIYVRSSIFLRFRSSVVSHAFCTGDIF